ncbi:MAG: bifunctional riboflavin kinase/FAD synthetase [Candidatus Rokuibacteriota bacterium]
MRIVRGLESYPSDASASVVALGVFDGVHCAHRAILDAAVTRAREAGLVALACTFDPHPAEVLSPGRAPAPITTLGERLDLIAGAGLDATVVLAFSRDLAVLEPEAFVEAVLLDRLRARAVVVGFNHRFGRAARGDARLLESLAGRLGFAAHVVPPLVVDGGPVSSTAVRMALQAGDVEAAMRLLGRAYSVTGPVVPGAARGRTLGFPTANVQPERPVLVPAGVYACRAETDGDTRRAVVNVGVRPTFEETVVTVEAHLLDFTSDLYGRRLTLGFQRRLRDEIRFASVDALRAQIARDIEATLARD